jgi:hypothetical protein
MRRKRRSLVVVSILAVLPVLMPAAANAATGPIELGILPNDEDSTVTAVGDRGQLVGESCSTEPHTHWCTGVKWDRAGRMSVLPSFGGGFSGPEAVNYAGVIVGWALGRDLQSNAARWSPDGSITLLPGLAGRRAWSATGISSTGVVVGSGTGESSNEVALRWDPSGKVTQLAAPPLPGSYSAEAITRDGRFIAGRFYAEDGSTRVLRWDSAGAVTVLGPESELTWFADMNSFGEIVGRTTINDRYAAVKWTAAGQMIELAWPNSYTTEVHAINNSGVAVGYGYDDAGKQVPVRWASDGSVTVLPGTEGMAEDIHEDGRIVGMTGVTVETARAALWDKAGAHTDLGILPGGGYSRAQLIGRDGTIAGGGVAADGRYHAAYWPVG